MQGQATAILANDGQHLHLGGVADSLTLDLESDQGMLGIDTQDELCNFETLAMHNFGARFVPSLAEPPTARQFVRDALRCTQD